MNASRVVTAIAWTVVALVFAGFAIMLLFVDPRWSVLALSGDDAGYYFHLARNLCLGFGFSFDRIEPSNGFNPLFPWMLVGPYRLLGSAPSIDWCYRIGTLLSWGAYVWGLASFARVSKGLVAAADGWDDALVACAALWYAVFIAPKAYYGMDAPLVVALGAAYGVRVLRAGVLAPGARAAIVDGVLLALVFFARVDSLPFLVAAFVFMAAAGRGQPGTVGRWLARAAVVAVIVAPWAVWSEVVFGSWVPISARIKTSFPHLDVAQSLAAIRGTSLNVVDQLSFLVAWLLAIVSTALALPRAFRRGGLPTRGADAVLGVFSLYLAMRLTYFAAFSRFDVQGSYVILAHVYNGWMMVRGIDALARRAGERYRSGALALGASAVLLLALVLFAGKSAAVMDRWGRVRAGGVDDVAIGREIQRRTSPTDVLYGGAFGISGFFSDRAWINGDGVINTLAYQEALNDGRLADYLAARKVSRVVFVTHQAEGPFIVGLQSTLLGGRDTLRVGQQDVVGRYPTIREGGGDVVLARWSAPAATR